MKTQIIKSIFFYALISIFFLLNTNAQIVYTDVNPDSTSSGTFNLDLNNDGVIDFAINVSGATMTSCGYIIYMRVTPSGSNQVADYTTSRATKMSINTVIDSSTTTWSGSSNQLLIEHSDQYNTAAHACLHINLGQWYSAVDGYMGLKLIVNNNTFYGWLRMDTWIASSFTIKDYAYNSTSNQSILAGQTCLPQAAIKANGPLSFCSGGNVVLTSKNSGNTLNYQWKKNNININGATNKNYTATTAGDYKVKVTDILNNCFKTSAIKTVTVPCRMTNENIAGSSENLLVYPNPATNSVTIKFPSDKVGQIQIVNLFGQIVFSEKVNAEQTQIDVSKFSEGIYVVRWSSGENNEMKTFSVTK